MGISRNAGNSFDPEIKWLEVMNPGPLSEGDEETTEAGVNVKWDSPLRSQISDFTDGINDTVWVLRCRSKKLK